MSSISLSSRFLSLFFYCSMKKKKNKRILVWGGGNTRPACWRQKHNTLPAGLFILHISVLMAMTWTAQCLTGGMLHCAFEKWWDCCSLVMNKSRLRQNSSKWWGMAVAAMDFSNRLPLTLLTFGLTCGDSEQTTNFHCSTGVGNDKCAQTVWWRAGDTGDWRNLYWRLGYWENRGESD